MSTIAAMSLQDFLGALGAKSPAPGGGAAACVAGAVAAALAQMVVAYSIGKKDLAGHEAALREASGSLERARALFLRLADEDAQAYALVNELSRLAETDPRRRAEYAGALDAATNAPRAALAGAASVAERCARLVTITNRRLASDLAIAAVLSASAARSAAWNIRANAPSMGDRASAILAEADAAIERADSAARAVEEACA